jgi:hypothetical protein
MFPLFTKAKTTNYLHMNYKHSEFFMYNLTAELTTFK